VKSTFSEAQVRGLLSICEHANADAVRTEPVVREGAKEDPITRAIKGGHWNKLEGDSMKVIDVQVDVYANPGGWTDGYHLRPSGRWCPPGSDHWNEPAEAP
jgi:hypothetical protein